jgi:uncharacterized protein involved in cysteine biosynthesis
MPGSYLKAFAQLFDPAFARILLKGLLFSLLAYVLLYAGIGWGVSQLHLFGIGWADALTDLLGGLTVMALTLLLAPGVMLLVLSFFLEEVAAAVEARHYPGLPESRRQSLTETVWIALRFTAVTLLANLAALPIYLALLLFGLGPLAFLLINGYLLSRDYFELVASRRLEPDQADTLRRAHVGRLWLGGVGLALMSMVPGLNLVVPLIATAGMLHELERLRRRDGFC